MIVIHVCMHVYFATMLIMPLHIICIAHSGLCECSSYVYRIIFLSFPPILPVKQHQIKRKSILEGEQ